MSLFCAKAAIVNAQSESAGGRVCGGGLAEGAKLQKTLSSARPQVEFGLTLEIAGDFSQQQAVLSFSTGPGAAAPLA